MDEVLGEVEEPQSDRVELVVDLSRRQVLHVHDHVEAELFWELSSVEAAFNNKQILGQAKTSKFRDICCTK